MRTGVLRDFDDVKAPSIAWLCSAGDCFSGDAD
jgi:hypothetical protein